MRVPVRVKVCCMSSRDEADMAVVAGADALGLVGPMPSGPGVLDDATLAGIAAHIPPPVAGVLLTSREWGRDIADHVRQVGVSVVQVVREIDPAEAEALARLAPTLRRIQVLHVEDAGALERMASYAPYVHAFLLDSGRPGLAVAELGGTGRAHDWSISAAFVAKSPRPVFLAGGLNSGNVAEAVRQVRPFGVDVCTGVRTEGTLDGQKLAAFMAAVAGA
jgi:phosphoribosylanthranilate isomerase